MPFFPGAGHERKSNVIVGLFIPHFQGTSHFFFFLSRLSLDFLFLVGIMHLGFYYHGSWVFGAFLIHVSCSSKFADLCRRALHSSTTSTCYFCLLYCKVGQLVFHGGGLHGIVMSTTSRN